MKKRLLFYILFGALILNQCFVANNVGALSYTAEARVGKVEQPASESEHQEASIPDAGSHGANTESVVLASAGGSIVLISALTLRFILLIRKRIIRK